MAEWRTVERVILPRHGEAIRLAGLITGGRQAAEEAVQEAIVRAAVAGHDLRAPGSAWWWFRRIVVHEALRIARREARAVATDLADDLPDNAPLPGEALVAAEEGAAAWAALRTLSPALRAAITLRHVAGLTVPETAAVLGVPPGTVKSRCAAARALLRIRIDRPLPEVVEMASEAFRHIRVAGVDFPLEPLEPHGSARQRDLSGDELRVLLPEVAWSEGWPDGLRCVRAAYMDLGRHRLGHVWFQGDGARRPARRASSTSACPATASRRPSTRPTATPFGARPPSSTGRRSGSRGPGSTG